MAELEIIQLNDLPITDNQVRLQKHKPDSEMGKMWKCEQSIHNRYSFFRCHYVQNMRRP